jgi:plastocyanin
MSGRVANGRLVAACMALALTLGPGPLPADTAAADTERAAVNSVQAIRISNFTFSPASVEVKAGTRVQWVNDDDAPHAVVGTDPGSPLKSAALDTDDVYSLVLNEPGTYHYFCSLHPHMTGLVIVK